MNIIGTSHQVISEYNADAKVIFDTLNEELVALIQQSFQVTYEGPDAEKFNAELLTLVSRAASEINNEVARFVSALNQVTTNISRSLGAGESSIVYSPPAMDLPAPPAVAADDYKIDIARFEQMVAQVIPQHKEAMVMLLHKNVERFNQIPQATVQTRGWSGESRNYAQNSVVPSQTENLLSVVHHVTNEMIAFMETTKSNVSLADAA